MTRGQLKRKLQRERRIDIIMEILEAIKAAAIGIGVVVLLVICTGVADWICAL